MDDRQPQLDALYAEMFPPPPPAEPRAPRQPFDGDDQELLEKMFASRNGRDVAWLWRGDTSRYYGDDSAADLALCSHLAFWTGDDPARVDSLFRGSGLMRPKWDERRGDSTYGWMTIEKALGGAVYTAPSSEEGGTKSGAEEQATQSDRNDGRDQGASAGPLTGDALAPSRFDARPVDLSKCRPVEFTYYPWLVRGALNLEVGEEDVGKSTLSAHIAAGITKGTLPGVHKGKPQNVLMVSADEDDFNKIVVPRLIAAGADMARVFEFYAKSEDDIFTTKDGPELARVLTERVYGLVVFEHLMDLVPSMRDYTDPVAMRVALRPLGRVLSARDVGGQGTLHVNKAQAKSLREKQQGSVQFGARSRSSFLVARHPSDMTRRVAILGKSNYVDRNGDRAGDEPTSISFGIRNETFDLNGYTFNVGRVHDVRAEVLTIDDVLSPDSEGGRRHKREAVAEALKAFLRKGASADALKDDCTLHPGFSLAELAKEIKKNPKDGTVRNALKDLADDGVVQLGKDRRWRPTPNLFDDEGDE
jgi:hypothetical protein